MAFQILNSILPFAVHRFVEILDNLRARRLRLLEMSIHIVDEYCERLRPNTGLRGALSTFSRQAKHNPSVSKMHLRALRWVAVAIVLGESKHAGQPRNRLGDVLINEVGKDDIGRYGTILHSVIL